MAKLGANYRGHKLTTIKTKVGARKTARYLQSGGFKTRIGKVKGGYHVYRHR